MGAMASQITSISIVSSTVFRRRSKKTSNLRVTGLCVGNSPVTGEFPAQRASNAENVSIWWRHHEEFDLVIAKYYGLSTRGIYLPYTLQLYLEIKSSIVICRSQWNPDESLSLFINTPINQDLDDIFHFAELGVHVKFGFKHWRVILWSNMYHYKMTACIYVGNVIDFPWNRAWSINKCLVTLSQTWIVFNPSMDE